MTLHLLKKLIDHQLVKIKTTLKRVLQFQMMILLLLLRANFIKNAVIRKFLKNKQILTHMDVTKTENP